MNVGESQITQSLKVRDLCVTFHQFLNFDDHITAICRSAYFHIRNIGKIRNLLSYNACSTIIYALMSRRESYVNMRLGADHHQLFMPSISKDCSNTCLERSFIYAAPCEWNKLSECIRTTHFDLFRKSVKTMLVT